MNALEELGRLYLQRLAQDAEYDKLLGLLAKVAAGEVRPDQVEVDLAKRGWSIKLTGPELAEQLKPGAT